jgi:hypothetical protein
MSSISIRHGEVADAALLAELAAHTFAEAYGANSHPADVAAHNDH